jgi:hypothetical protein
VPGHGEAADDRVAQPFGCRAGDWIVIDAIDGVIAFDIVLGILLLDLSR